MNGDSSLHGGPPGDHVQKQLCVIKVPNYQEALTGTSLTLLPVLIVISSWIYLKQILPLLPQTLPPNLTSLSFLSNQQDGVGVGVGVGVSPQIGLSFTSAK